MNDFSEELAAAKGIAQQAGEIILKYFNEDQHVERKEDDSPVTIADKLVNQLVIDELAKHFDDAVLGEEKSTGEYGMGRRWVCDPIDGTKAYVWGLPTAMFSLALVVDGEPVLGVAFDPFLGRLYEAVLGSGSFCNGTQLRVSKQTLQEGYTAVTSNVERVAHDPSAILRLEAKGARFAAFSGAVYKMCLIAQGKLLGYAESHMNAHDIAAAHVIVEEAGGTVTALDGSKLSYLSPFKGGILSNGIIHSDLVDCYRRI